MPNDEGFGFLFPVKPEDKKTNGPSMTGKVTLNGTEVDIAGWTKTSRAGAKYLSLKVQGYAMPAPDVDESDLPI